MHEGKSFKELLVIALTDCIRYSHKDRFGSDFHWPKDGESNMKIGGLFIVIFWIAAISGYFNIYKATQCDYVAPYKCEAVRIVGVFAPPVGAIAGYLDLGQ